MCEKSYHILICKIIAQRTQNTNSARLKTQYPPLHNAQYALSCVPFSI